MAKQLIKAIMGQGLIEQQKFENFQAKQWGLPLPYPALEVLPQVAQTQQAQIPDTTVNPLLSIETVNVLQDMAFILPPDFTLGTKTISDFYGYCAQHPSNETELMMEIVGALQPLENSQTQQLKSLVLHSDLENSQVQIPDTTVNPLLSIETVKVLQDMAFILPPDFTSGKKTISEFHSYCTQHPSNDTELMMEILGALQPQ